ncbi:MAG: GGDEF domain-containing protein [Lachnospiraceae bacterium]|nr:GGDEF domain-containing protein [Lachnospiraceae bacterium]
MTSPLITADYSITITASVMSIIICMVILLAQLSVRDKSDVKKTFNKLLISNIIGSVAVIIVYAKTPVEEALRGSVASIVSNWIMMVMILPVVYYFAKYTKNIAAYDQICARKQKKLLRTILISGLVCAFVLGIYAAYDIMGIAPKMFDLPLHAVYYLYCLVIILLIFAHIGKLLKRKSLSRKYGIPILLYLMLIVVGQIVSLTVDQQLVYTVSTIAFLLLFIFVQSDTISMSRIEAVKKALKEAEETIALLEESRRENATLEKRSNTDELTGLLNRMAYSSYVKELEQAGIDDNVWYVGVDVNGLKMANDTNGHEAGDELIKGTADCLKSAFADLGPVFRMGGDEFTAILSASKEEFDKALLKLDATTWNWTGTFSEKLSFSKGYVNASELEDKKIINMSKEADKRMYSDKKAFYNSHEGFERRSSRR